MVENSRLRFLFIEKSIHVKQIATLKGTDFSHFWFFSQKFMLI